MEQKSVMEELILPCPLCGGKNQEDVFIGYVDFMPSHFKISCVPCGLQITADRRDKVISNWNNREQMKDEAIAFSKWKDMEYAYLGEDKYCDAYDQQFPRNIKTLAQVYSHYKENNP